jgi:ribonuclease HI
MIRLAVIREWRACDTVQNKGMFMNTWVTPGFVRIQRNTLSVQLMTKNATIAHDVKVTVQVYTDGAGPTEHTTHSGWGAVTRKQLKDGDVKVTYAKGLLRDDDPNTAAGHTNNTAEMHALKVSLREAGKHASEGEVVEIYSDSAYAIRAATGHIKIKKRTKNKGLIKELRGVYSIATKKGMPGAVRVRKVKGHQQQDQGGKLWNDIADELAGAGRDKQPAPSHSTQLRVQEVLGTQRTQSCASSNGESHEEGETKLEAIYTKDGKQECVAAFVETLRGECAGFQEIFIAELHTHADWRRTGKATALVHDAAIAAGPHGIVRLLCRKYRCQNCKDAETQQRKCDMCGMGARRWTRASCKAELSDEYKMYTKYLGMEDMHVHRNRSAPLHRMYEKLRKAGENVNDVSNPRESVMLVGNAATIAERTSRKHATARTCAHTTYGGQETWSAGRSKNSEMRSMRRQCVALINEHLKGTEHANEGEERLAAPIADAHSIWAGYENRITIVWRTDTTVAQDVRIDNRTRPTSGDAHERSRATERQHSTADRHTAWQNIAINDAAVHARKLSTQVDAVEEILRAEDAFGVLGVPVVAMRLTPQPTLDDLAKLAHADVESAKHEDAVKTQTAHRKIDAAHKQLSCRNTQQRLRKERIQEERPIVHTLRCEIDIRAIEALMRTPIANKQPKHKNGQAYQGGTYLIIANEYIRKIGGNGTDKTWVTLTYRHSMKGHMYRKAGVVMDSRVYAVNTGIDPFRLPKAIRNAALTGRYDMDDSASYPRAALHMIPIGAEITDTFLQYRKSILKQIGEHFLPMNPAAEQYEAAKKLTNLLDMDGELQSWYKEHAVPPTRTLHGARIKCMCAMHEGQAGTVACSGGECGTRFDLAQYIDEQPKRTKWIAEQKPRAVRYTIAMNLAMGDANKKPERTLKSYILQEAEAISRQVKMTWAAVHGHEVHNIQHDGIVIALKAHMSATRAEELLTEACTHTLGYTQPVEHKPYA